MTSPGSEWVIYQITVIGFVKVFVFQSYLKWNRSNMHGNATLVKNWILSISHVGVSKMNLAINLATLWTNVSYFPLKKVANTDH